MGVFFTSRMSLRELAALCRRLATSLSAGIDVRKVLGREAQQARSRTARRHLAAVSNAIAQGEGLSAALGRTGDFFPPLFHEMVEVGEETGKQAEVFAQLAEHYEHQLQLRRNFLAAITWPMVQLLIAVGVVGFLIWIAGRIGGPGTTLDFLGLGLVGERGLAIYLGIVATAAVVLFVIIRAFRRGLVWAAPIQRAVFSLPVLGPALQTIALARLAWSMHLTMSAGMEVRRALRLSLNNTRNARYTRKIGQIETSITAGNSIYESFREAGCFPYDFLDTVQVGEHSGKLVESMALLSRQYREQARAALSTLNTLAGVAVWMVVAALIIVLIFRLFFFYMGVLNGAMG
jgi:type II secretory pathway component PulF